MFQIEGFDFRGIIILHFSS